MVDKGYCMSSYLAFRYIEREDVEFREDMRHRLVMPTPDQERVPVRDWRGIDAAITETFEGLRGKRLGILLSGGMDSANLAAYMPGADAYTFRFLNGTYQAEELARAEKFAAECGLTLHYVDINWDTMIEHLEPVICSKCAPVHSIEPQLLQAALQAKTDGVERLIIGESADLVFGGMDGLLSQNWTVEAFAKRYTFCDPALVLRNPVDVSYLYERYRIRDTDRIDFLSFMDDVFSIESSSSYMNAFEVAGMPYTDPYACLRMADPLDLARVRGGEPKYLIRDLFQAKYPNLPIPDKNPMPRPVDSYFADWEGPKRPEFRDDIEIDKFSGNQRWQMWCLEQFLDLIEG